MCDHIDKAGYHCLCTRLADTIATKEEGSLAAIESLPRLSAGSVMGFRQSIIFTVRPSSKQVSKAIPPLCGDNVTGACSNSPLDVQEKTTSENGTRAISPDFTDDHFAPLKAAPQSCHIYI